MAKSCHKILSIDDHKDNLISLRALILEAFPEATILMAENGPAGIELALSQDPDVVLLDVVMPGMDGFEVCQKLKANPSTRDIPVVFITALKGDKRSRIQALEVGAEAFLAKPIDETELTAQIRAMQKIKAANNQKRLEKEVLAQRVAEQTRALEQAQAATLLLLENLKKENEFRKENEITLQHSQKAFIESERFARATLDALSAHLAILDENGIILTVNHAWRTFAQTNAGEMAKLCEGANYLKVCDAVRGPESETAAAFSAGIRAVQRKEVEDFSFEYACHSPKEKRWFIGRVTRFNDTDSHKVVVAHENITERKLAEETLRLKEEQYRLLHESAGVGIGYYSSDGVVISYNAIAAKHMGGEPEDFFGKSIFDLFPKAAADAYMARIRKAIVSDSIQEYEDRVDLPGQPKWFISACSRILSASNQVSGVQIISTDISRLKQAEEALRENQMMLANILDSVPQTIFWKDRAGVYLGCNEKFAQTVGLNSPDQIIGKTDYDLPWPRAVADAYRADDQEVISKNQPKWHIIEQGRRADGTSIWADTTKTPLVDMTGNPYGVLGVYDDITERKLTEQKLQESEERYRGLVQNLQIGLVVHAPDTSILFSNPKASQLLGLTPDQMLGKSAIDPEWCFIREDATRMPEEEYPVNRALAGKAPLSNLVLGILRPDQEGATWVQCNVYLDWGQDGKLQQIVVTFADITERKRAEEALFNSNKKYQALFETLSEGVALNEVIYDDSGEMVDYRILEVNTAFYEIADYAGPVLGNVATKLYGMTSDFIKAFWRQHIHKKTIQIVEMTSPLRGRTYLVYTSPFENDRFMTSFIDITERKKAEIALRENELALNKAQQVAHVGSWIWYISQDRLEWSDEMYQIFGIEKAGFSGKLSEVISNAIHPDDRAAVEQSNNSVIQEKKPIPLEYRIIRLDGTTRVVWAEAGELISNKDGQPEILSGIVQDITERKLIEQKNTEQLNELRRWYSAMLGREKRTIELKKEVNDLLAKAGLPPRYLDPLHGSG